VSRLTSGGEVTVADPLEVDAMSRLELRPVISWNRMVKDGVKLSIGLLGGFRCTWRRRSIT
jgi:hypothetical protein